MAEMDLGSCMLLLVLLIYGSISQISYVGKGYVTALKSSSEEITDNNHLLGYSFTGPIHYEVMKQRRTKAPPPPPRANIIRGVNYPPAYKPKPPSPPNIIQGVNYPLTYRPPVFSRGAPFPPSFPPPEEPFPPPPGAPFDPPQSFPAPEAPFPPLSDAPFLQSYPPPPDAITPPSY